MIDMSLDRHVGLLFGVMLILLGILMLVYNSIYGSGDLNITFGDLDFLKTLWNLDMNIFWMISYGLYILGGIVIIVFSGNSTDDSVVKAMSVGTALLFVSIGEVILQNPAGLIGGLVAIFILSAEDYSYWYYIGWFTGLAAFVITIIGCLGTIVETFAVSQTAFMQCIILLWIAVMNIIATTWFLTDCRPGEIV